MAARRLAAVAVAAGIAAALLVLLGHDAPSGGVAPRAAVLARAQLSPATAEFGDRIDARVVAVVDARRVDVSRIVVDESFAPLTQLGPTQRDVSRRGDLATLVMTTPVACLAEACVDSAGRVQVNLQLVRVHAQGRVLTVRWPRLTVRGRVSSADLMSPRTALRADVSPPSVTYRIAPSMLATLLDVVAALLAAGAVGIAGFEVVCRVHRSGSRTPDALARALELVREAESRRPPDRRRALELLDRTLLGARSDVRDLAWSQPEPTGEQLVQLVDHIRAGHGPE